MQEYLVGTSIPLTLMALVAIARWLRTILRQLEDVHKLAVNVDSSINSRPQGDPTIYEMVVANGESSARVEDQLERHVEDDDRNFSDLRERLASLADDT